LPQAGVAIAAVIAGSAVGYARTLETAVPISRVAEASAILPSTAAGRVGFSPPATDDVSRS